MRVCKNFSVFTRIQVLDFCEFQYKLSVVYSPIFWLDMSVASNHFFDINVLIIYAF